MKSIYFTGQNLTNILPHDAVVFGTAVIFLVTKKQEAKGSDKIRPLGRVELD